MSLINYDDARSALIAELLEAVEHKLETFRDTARSSVRTSDIKISLTHLHEPLREVDHWALGGTYTYHADAELIEPIMPTWLEYTLQHYKHHVITLWLREDRLLAISYANPSPLHDEVGYELLDLSTMTKHGINQLIQMVRSAQ